MQSSKDYLQEKIGPCVVHLFQHYLPDEDFKSVHDLFNVQKFYKLLMCILSEEVKSKINDLRLHEQSENQTYNEMRLRNFKRIYEIIQQSYDILGEGLVKKISDKEINGMIENSDMRVMILFMEYVFELLKHNKNVLEFITTLDESIQSNIMEVMQNSQLSSYHDDQFHLNSQHSISSLKMMSKISPNDQPQNMSQLQEMENHMQKMQSHIQLKDDEIKDLKFIKEQLQQEIEEFKKQVHHKNEQIQIFKKRMVSYQEIDQLLLQKDEEILKLTKKLADHELKSRLKQSELTNEIKSLHQKLNQLDSKDAQISLKYDKQKAIIQQLNKQKDQAEISMKKVINNLKQKNKSLMDKLNDIQTQLTQVKFEKEMKEKQLNQIKLHQNGRKSLNMNFDDLNSPRSPSKQDITEGIESMTGNYSRLGEQLSLQLDRADLEDEFGLVQKPTGNKRFNQLLQQNYALKQQLQKLQSAGFADSKQFKQLQDQIQKMKKKINILKRRNDEIQNQRKEQIDIMVGIIDQCYSQSLNKTK